MYSSKICAYVNPGKKKMLFCAERFVSHKWATKKKECWIVSVDCFRLGIEPRLFVLAAQYSTVELLKYPHDIARNVGLRLWTVFDWESNPGFLC